VAKQTQRSSQIYKGCHSRGNKYELDFTRVKIHPTASPGNAGTKGTRVSNITPKGKLWFFPALQQEGKQY